MRRSAPKHALMHLVLGHHRARRGHALSSGFSPTRMTHVFTGKVRNAHELAALERDLLDAEALLETVTQTAPPRAAALREQIVRLREKIEEKKRKG